MGGVVDLADGLTGGMASDLTGRTGQRAAENAARLQGAATDKAVAETKRQFDIGREDVAPWLAAGRKGLTKYQAALGLDGDQAAQLQELQSSPGYQFRLAQGQRGLNAGLAARGGMGAGKAMTAAQQYGQDYASNEYNNRLAQLANLSGVGQQMATGQQQAGAQYAGNLSNLWTQNANAQGAAGMAGANARQSGILGLIQAGTNVLSDRRLKADIKRIGTHKTGAGIYSWCYVDMPEDFPVEYASMAKWGQNAIGVMADEIKEIIPEAVMKVGQYDAVNYSMVDAYGY